MESSTIESEKIKLWARKIGFQDCGIARSRFLNDEYMLFTEALAEQRHAKMRFLERNAEDRFNPESLLSGCRSVIVVTYNYLTATEQKSDVFRMARYTWIEDYHTIMRNLLTVLAEKIDSEYGIVNHKITVDSSSISEKNWAVRAGIGRYGKNGIIHNQNGSFFVIGTLLIDKFTDKYDAPCTESDCGNCTLCIDNCPTHALSKPFSVDANKCVSYLNTESKSPDFSNLGKEKYIFGCDICQEICPKNKKIVANMSNETKTSLFLPLENSDYEEMDKDGFGLYFSKTSVARRKFERFKSAIDAKKRFLT